MASRFATGKRALSISDRSGAAFPYIEMVREWTGAWVHISEFEIKQPQLNPRPVGADPQALQHARTPRTEFYTPTILPNNPFTTTAASTTVTVNQPNHGRSTGDAVSFTNVQGATGGGAPAIFLMETTLVYPIPDATAAANYLNIYYVRRIQDVDSTYTDATDLPYRFLPPMVSGLAFYLSMKYAPQRTQELKLLYEDEFARALAEDGSAASTYITPKAYYPEVT